MALTLVEQLRSDPCLLFMDGNWQPASTNAFFDDFNPTTGARFAQVALGGIPDIESAIRSAERAFPSWAAAKPSQKEAIFLKAADLLLAQKSEYMDLLVHEAGSTLGKAVDEIKKSVALLRAAAGDVRQSSGKVIPADGDKWSFSQQNPLGVVAAITPWNVPLYLSLKKVILALAAGNTVVLKPSSETPVIGLQIGALLAESGLPAGVLNVVTGPGGEIGSYMVEHPSVRMVSVTGESATGKKIAQLAAAHLKRFSLELGGKNPVLVFKDADLSYAVNAIAFGAFHHQGQNCMSVDRIIAEEPVYEEVISLLTERAKSLRVGPPWDQESQLGPMINRKQLDSVHRRVVQAVAGGARLTAGGQPEPPYYPPTVVADVKPEMALFQEETFGPVAPVICARDVEDAIQLANNSRYGLAAGIFTRDIDLAMYAAGRMETGMVHINDGSIYAEPQSPFGGVKDSGFGREGSGGWSIAEMTETKWITMQMGRRKFPFDS